jgi:hypothetical protein
MDQESARIDMVFSRQRDWLEVRLHGTGARLEAVIDYWQRLYAELKRTGVRQALVVDHTKADGTLSREEFDRLHEVIVSGDLPRDVKIAFVVRDAGILTQVEYVAILGRVDGRQISLFRREEDAARWLRYGED